MLLIVCNIRQIYNLVWIANKKAIRFYFLIW